MKINNISIIGIIAGILIAIIVLDLNLFALTPFMNIILKIIIIVGIFLLIRSRCCCKDEDSKIYADLNVLKESTVRIEKKLDKIDDVLEKVSE